MKDCPVCGKSYNDIEFCPEDGAKLRSPTKMKETSALTPEEEQQSKPDKFSEKVRKFHDKVTGNDRNNIPKELRPDVVTIKNIQVSTSGYIERECQLAKEKNKYVFRRFKLGSLTPENLYERLKRTSSPCIPDLCKAGVVSLDDGTQLDFELTSKPQHYVTLEHWLSKQPVSENKVKKLLHMLVEFVDAFQTIRLLPISLSPMDLLVVNEALKLAHLGALVEYSHDVVFRKALDASPLLSRPYSDPELTDSSAIHANAFIFSIGQLLCHALFGEAFTYADIKQGRIPFGLIEDSWLATVIMGCLWPEANGRFSLEEFQKLASEPGLNYQEWPEIKHWQSLNVQNSECFSFAGDSFFTARDLLRSMIEPSHWEQAIQVLPRAYQWLKGHTNYGSAVEVVEGSGRTTDWQLVALTRTICPEIPITWRSLVLDDKEIDKSLISLGQKALDGDKDAQKLVDKLFEADLRELP